LQKENTDEQTNVQEVAGSETVNVGINSVGPTAKESKVDHPRQHKEGENSAMQDFHQGGAN
jgi:hypothetical protein